VRTVTTGEPGGLLTQAAAQRRTGALVVAGNPGGTVYLVAGHVIYAESPAAPGVGELLTASGRLAARAWQAAADAAATVGRTLVDQGHLTQGELELCVLGAVYDAGYFALSPPSAPVEFADGATHRIGPVVRVEPAAVIRETRRRARLLDDIFPDARIDTAPVLPVPRPPVERVALTAAQWELLVHADGQRTPADLALLLGRAGYATIQELRRLARLGLIEAPQARDRTFTIPDFVRLPGARGDAADVRGLLPPRQPPAASDGLDAAPRQPPVAADGLDGEPRRSPVTSDGLDTAPPQQPVTSDGPDTAPPPPPVACDGPDGEPPRHGREPEPEAAPLARRRPGARLPGEAAADGAPPAPADEVLLARLRTALRALR
jgi:hypothetical protein